MVHKALVGRVQECEVDHRGLKGGHGAVRMVLEGKAPKLLERVLRRREKLPLGMPIGCRRAPFELAKGARQVC